MFRRIASTIGGILVGIVLAEVGLRLYFQEHEANRNYWGPYAFVEDDVLPYRHAPSATAIAGREASFGPHRITTNELGFRDRRIPVGTAAGPRVVVAGASFAFGLGVEKYEDLFHVQLERRLREREDSTQELEVFNIAQTGFRLDEVCALIKKEVGRFEPRLVVLLMRADERGSIRRKSPDVVNGYRLEQGRRFCGTWVDDLRTRSYLWMRLPRLPRALRDVSLRRMASYKRSAKSGESASAGEPTNDKWDAIDVLSELRGWLQNEGIDLVCVPIYRPDDTSFDFSDRLRQRGLLVVEARTQPDWCLPREGHWNTYGHGKAAEVVARQIPSSYLRAP